MKANYIQLLKEAIEELFDYNSSYYEKIFILINQVDENTDFVELSIQISNIIYECLEKTYIFTTDKIKAIYEVNPKVPTVEELLQVFDGLTINDRVKIHINELKNHLPVKNHIDELKNPLPIDIKSAKLKCQMRMILLVNNEAMTLYNRLFFEKLKEYATSGQILTADDGCCDKCYDVAPHGVVSIELLEQNLPPYHPDCRCFVVYYLGKEEI